MKINYKKSILCVILILAVIMIFSTKSQAAGLVINFSKSTANVGDTVTVTVTGNGVSGRVNLSASGNATLSESSVFVDNGSASITLTVNGTGSIRVTATAADMADSSTAEAFTGSTGGTITVSSASSGGSSPSGSSSSSGSTTGVSTTSTQKSSNANLSNLGIRPNDFSGFTPGTTTYNVTVPENVENVEVYATAQDSGATIAGTGNKTLDYGENTLSVVGTAEDGTTKTYTINVTREGEELVEEAIEEATEIVNGLSNITIGDLKLSPSFKTGVYEYTVKYIGEDTSLDIRTVTTDPSYTVEIIGNEELKEGENTITILVSDSEGNNVATYQLTVNKSIVNEEALAREEEERQQQEQRRLLMIAGGITALILIIVIIIVVKRRRNRAYAEEFSGVPFAGINEDEYYDDYNQDNQFNNYHDEPVNEESDTLQENYDNEVLPTEENNSEDYQETSTKIEFDDSKEKREKERAKRDFLEGYNSDYTDEYEEDRSSRGRRKGKRFK